MNKKIKALILPLSIMFLTGCVTPSFGPTPSGRTSKTSSPTSEPTSEPTTAPTSAPTSEPTTTPTPTSSTSGSSDVEIPDGAYNGYYDLSKYNLNAKQSAGKMQVEINKLMLDTHKTLIKYADFKYYEKTNSTKNPGISIDQISETDTRNEFFYTGKQVTQSMSGFTREHVWPCAKSNGMWVHKSDAGAYYVDGANYVGGGSDLYHIRPCADAVNTARGDSRFKEYGEAERETLYKSNDGGPYTLYCTASSFSDYSEPADEFKGDIARLLVYVWVHYTKIGNYYEQAGWSQYVGNLALTDVTAFGADEKTSAYKMLVRWNELDPVSETEKLRNDTVQKIQGNRNPFVDYPHLLKKCLLG